MEKIKAHRLGKRHRAISVLVFNRKGEMLIQQRSKTKYHCPEMWANACCTHPRDGESVIAAGQRRLKEEMSFECKLTEKLSFVYKIKFKNGLIENEYDHVLVGQYDGEVRINPKEVENYKWISLKDLKMDLIENPDIYVFWFKEIMKRWRESREETG